MSTITHLVTSTDVITLVQPTLGGNGLEQFSFVEQNGDTMWLEGKTPPSSLTYAVMTSNIRIQPLPSTAIVPQKDEVIPSGEFLLTDSRFDILMMFSHWSADSVTTAKKAYTGHGSAGWNATTFSTVIGSSPALKSTASAIEKDMLLTDSASLKSYPTTFATRRVKARDVGDMVFAKINGVMVSWANLYDGSSPVTSALSILEPSSCFPLEFCDLSVNSFRSFGPNACHLSVGCPSRSKLTVVNKSFARPISDVGAISMGTSFKSKCDTKLSSCPDI